jgi:hypothetical protein
MEKMLVCEALDERDFLQKKILADIKRLRGITVKRQKDPKTVYGISVEEFTAQEKALYQSIIDQTARYKRINVAIIMSNAKTEITLRSGIKMTVAEAIGRKSMLNSNMDLDFRLYDQLKDVYHDVMSEYDRYRRTYDSKKNDYTLGILQSSKAEKLTEDQVKLIDVMCAGEEPELVDAIGTKDKDLLTIINENLVNNHDLIKEINSAIKISNATTVVEF